MTTRREFIKKAGLASAAGLLLNSDLKAFSQLTEFKFASGAYPFKQTSLKFGYNDLEPNIDTATMQIHYEKHHATYVKTLNDALQSHASEVESLEQINKNISQFSEHVRNNAGGHYNHEMFWDMLTPGGSEVPGKLAEALNAEFGTVNDFKVKFTGAALSRFGSGWAWLIKSEGKLKVTSTPNQDNPLMDVVAVKGTPLLCLDVWEHAYYLRYQNKRVDYINNFWNVLDWTAVAKRLGV